jgi:hypothetical protein
MTPNKITSILFFLAFSFLSPLINSSQAADTSRGIQVVTIKNASGQEVGLYRESHALIIGMSDYQMGWPKLPGVIKDVEIVQKALEKHGFHVVQIRDQTRDQMFDSIHHFINNYGQQEDARLLIYFAGHGYSMKLTYGENMGYFVPIDSPNPNKNKAGFLSKALDMQQVEVWAKRIQSKHVLFMFDSCFSGSIFALSRAMPENISYKTSKPVRQFITAGAANELVPDESIFRSQFVAALEGEADSDSDGYLTGVELGEFLQKKVTNYSRGSQHPQYGKIRNPHLDKGDFVFKIQRSKKNGSQLSAKLGGSSDSEAGRLLRDVKKKLKQRDLEKIQKQRKLQDMKDHYSKLVELEAISDELVSIEAKSKAWKEFLDKYPTDNPHWNKANEKHQSLKNSLKAKEEKQQVKEKQHAKNEKVAKEKKFERSLKISKRFSMLKELNLKNTSIENQVVAWKLFVDEYQENNTHLEEAREQLARLEFQADFEKLKYQISGIFVTKKKKIKAWQSLIHKYENNEYLKGHELLGEAVAKLEKAKQEEGFKFGDLFRTRPAEGKNEIIDETQNASSQKPQENKAEKKVKSNNFGSSKAPTFETIDADILE